MAGEESDLIERLKMARMKAMFLEVDDKNEILQPPPTATHCSEHPGELLEYWCEEDRHAVCHECMIFGSHRGHQASRSRKRLETGEDLLAERTAALQTQIDTIEQAEIQYREQYTKMKNEVNRLLEETYEEGVNLLSTQVPNLKESLQLALEDVHSCQDSATHTMTTPFKLTVVPYSVEVQGTRLVIEKPTVKIGDGKHITDVDRKSPTETPTPPSTTTTCNDSSSSVRSTLSESSRPDRQRPSSPRHDEPQSSCKMESSTQVYREPLTSQGFKMQDLAQLDGAEVIILPGGDPGQFYCHQYSEDIKDQMARLEKLLDMPHEARITPLILGECVLARWDGVWHRATVMESEMTGWRCNLVDLGKVVTVATLEISDIPAYLLEIPVMAVSCQLVGLKGIEASEELMIDWEKIIKNKRFTMKVVNNVSQVVSMSNGDVSLTERLRFLRHIPSKESKEVEGQHFLLPEKLSSGAHLCADYDHISPDNILLYFDNPCLDYQLKLLQQVCDRKDVEGPPGDVQPGHAVLAPWGGKLYRAVVEKMFATDLVVFFVDFGNTDVVSWWDCFHVPKDLLFPPLATMVRLSGVRAEERGSWTKEIRNRLREILGNNNEGSKLGVRVVKIPSIMKDAVEVELTTADGKNAYDILVEDGYACGRTKEDETGGDLNNNNFREIVTPVEIKSELSLVDDHSVESFNNENYLLHESKLDEILFNNNRVYLTGCLPQHKVTELDLGTWAEEMWGQVNTIKIGYNQIIIDFIDVKTAHLCSKVGKTYYGNVPFQIFSSNLRLQNGVLVHALDPMSRRSDLLHIFSKFGEIAYTEWPFILPHTGIKAGLVVFKDPNSVEKVLGDWEIKQGNEKLRVERYSKSNLCMEVTVNNANNPTADVVTPEHAQDEEVEVVKIVSPDQVWARLMSDKDRWEEVHQAVQAEGHGIVHGRHRVKVGDKVVCKVPQYDAWYRASVKEVNKDTCMLKLVDLGDFVTADIQSVFPLKDHKLKNEKVCVRSVRLGRLEPAGSGGWSGSAVDFLLRRIGRRKVFLVRDEDGADDLVVEEVIADNPTDVETVSRESLSGLLLDRGLAFKMNTRSRCVQSWSTCMV